MVNDVLEDLDSIKNQVVGIGTDYLLKLREDEFIASLLHRHTLPGGKAEFDMPKYKFFLESDKKNVTAQINSWIGIIRPICEGIDKLMWIIRESNEPIATVAVGGQYNHQIERRTQISLVRIITNDANVYPEISGGRHLIAVRFFNQNKDGAYLQFEDNVEFKISLC
jgi:cell division protein ZapD